MSRQFLEVSHLRSSSWDGFSESCSSAGSRTSSAVVKQCISALLWQLCLALLEASPHCSGYLNQQDSLWDFC